MGQHELVVNSKEVDQLKKEIEELKKEGQKLKSETECLEQTITKLNQTVTDFQEALIEGSKIHNSKSVYHRLEQVELQLKFATQSCEDKMLARAQLMEERLAHKFVEQSQEFTMQIQAVYAQVERNTTRFTAHLEEVDRFKAPFLAIGDFFRKVGRKSYEILFTQEAWKKLVITAIGLITYSNLKEWGVIDWLTKMWNTWVN